MKVTITTPKQPFSPCSAPQGTKQTLHQFLNDPKSTEKHADASVPQEFQHSDGNTNDETKHYAEDCNVNADKYSKSHDYYYLMINDYVLKYGFILQR